MNDFVSGEWAIKLIDLYQQHGGADEFKPETIGGGCVAATAYLDTPNGHFHLLANDWGEHDDGSADRSTVRLGVYWLDGDEYCMEGWMYDAPPAELPRIVETLKGEGLRAVAEQFAGYCDAVLPAAGLREGGEA